MRQVTVSAPGKLMLMGEHAVVYGRPCLVTAINWRLKISVEILEESLLIVKTKESEVGEYRKALGELGKGEIPKEVKFVELALFNFLNKYPIEVGVSMQTLNKFPTQYGFGSSSAVTVCVIKALSELFNINLSNKELFDLCYKTVLDVQRQGSGFDVAAAIYGRTLYFKAGGSTIKQLVEEGIILVVGYSGVKSDTVAMMNLVQKKMESYKTGVEKSFDSIAKLVDEAKVAILDKDWGRLGTLMDYNQNYLEDLGVSTDKLNQMIEGARRAGAYGAKLSGAGGGDCMIAVVSADNKQRVSDAIQSVGGEIIQTEVNANGVTIISGSS